MGEDGPEEHDYSRADLDRLAKLSDATGRTEASLLREALDDLLGKYGDRL